MNVINVRLKYIHTAMPYRGDWYIITIKLLKRQKHKVKIYKKKERKKFKTNYYSVGVALRVSQAFYFRANVIMVLGLELKVLGKIQ